MRNPWESSVESGLTSAARDGSWEMYRHTCKAKAAKKAGYMANLLLEIHGALSFVTIANDRTSAADTDYWRVGIWEPTGMHDKGTIFADDEMVDLAQPLLKVIGQVQADVPLARQARHALFFEMEPREILPYHCDETDRVITSLIGTSEVYLQDRPRLDICRFELGPGDTYTMRALQPADDQPAKTTLHGVQNGNEPRLTMML